MWGKALEQKTNTLFKARDVAGIAEILVKPRFTTSNGRWTLSGSTCGM